MKVFLGGTCNNSIWRDVLIPLLTDNGINYFNPVVDDWTEDCYKFVAKTHRLAYGMKATYIFYLSFTYNRYIIDI